MKNERFTVITPPQGLVKINLPELLRFRELLYVFVWRDIKVRYKQTGFGIAWAIFQPFLTMIIFSVFFGRLAKVPSDNVPYPIFVYSGLLLWNYFSTALSNVSTSLVDNENIIKKIYFPRLILPIASAITPTVDFVISFFILMALMAYYHFMPGLLGVILLPVYLIISIISAVGIGLFLSAINVKFRDVRYILPFFIQILLYVTPIIYPVDFIPAQFQKFLFLNPMAGVVSVMRSTILQTTQTNWSYLLIAALLAIVLFIGGLAYFRKTERFFADVI